VRAFDRHLIDIIVTIVSVITTLNLEKTSGPLYIVT